ncbi:hypothetical protein NHQ30_010693 [Ciborinia camelliae]|nr:hypothetical protein NHQ30_010693 [Ciborinia camelliae]
MISRVSVSFTRLRLLQDERHDLDGCAEDEEDEDGDGSRACVCDPLNPKRDIASEPGARATGDEHEDREEDADDDEFDYVPPV